MSKIKTTRMELLKLKKKIKLASKGHKLLKEKRDALISEFFKIIDTLKSSRAEMEEEIQEAYRSLALALAVSGNENIKRAANSVKSAPEIIAKPRAIMGVKVPVFEFDEIKRTVAERGYSLLSTSIELDKAAENFEKILNILIKLAEIEATAIKLAEEIKKTKRKVNSLERIAIPRLERDARYISMRLEEMERENFTRLKIIKAVVGREETA